MPKRRGARTFSKTLVAAAATFLEGHLRKRSSSKIITESDRGGERGHCVCLEECRVSPFGALVPRKESWVKGTVCVSC